MTFQFCIDFSRLANSCHATKGTLLTGCFWGWASPEAEQCQSHLSHPPQDWKSGSTLKVNPVIHFVGMYVVSCRSCICVYPVVLDTVTLEILLSCKKSSACSTSTPLILSGSTSYAASVFSMPVTSTGATILWCGNTRTDLMQTLWWWEKLLALDLLGSW